MHLNSIHHVAIICSDYEKSKRFYMDVLGCKVIEETYRPERNSYKLDLQIGNAGRIELFSFPNPPKRVSDPEACGLRHLAFTVEDVSIVVRELKGKGIVVEPIRVSVDGKQFTFFRDPDALPIELYQK